MILTELEADSRLNSLDNLVNRLKVNKRNDVTLENTFTPPAVIDIIPVSNQIPFLPPKAEDLVADLEQKLKTQNIRSLASDVLENSLEHLRYRLDEVEKPQNLSRIATDMGKILKDTTEDSTSKNINNQQVIIYKPVMVTEAHYNSIQVNE